VTLSDIDRAALVLARTRGHAPHPERLVAAFSRTGEHATTSFAAARAYRRLAPAAALNAVAGMLALSRPYLGVHYPSDVLAGMLLGSVVAEVLS
jgi:PAP2 superfamily